MSMNSTTGGPNDDHHHHHRIRRTGERRTISIKTNRRSFRFSIGPRSKDSKRQYNEGFSTIVIDSIVRNVERSSCPFTARVLLSIKWRNLVKTSWEYRSKFRYHDFLFETSVDHNFRFECLRLHCGRFF